MSSKFTHSSVTFFINEKTQPLTADASVRAFPYFGKYTGNSSFKSKTKTLFN